MTCAVMLYGYRFSVYTRVARVVLHEKGVDHGDVEIDPFATPVPPGYGRLHPCGPVTVLRHGDFTVHETVAIATYVDSAFAGPALMPEEARARARVAQVIGIVDSYGYWPMVRQVFAHAVFRPFQGELSDPNEIAIGLQKSKAVLAALDAIAGEGRVLGGEHMTLADCHLAPMVDCFVRCEDGERALRAHRHLERWWEAVARRASMRPSDPGIVATGASPTDLA